MIQTGPNLLAFISQSMGLSIVRSCVNVQNFVAAFHFFLFIN